MWGRVEPVLSEAEGTRPGRAKLGGRRRTRQLLTAGGTSALGLAVEFVCLMSRLPSL
ncbi:hypothetical protein SBA1_980006 [Candidatus Sulfotelmatobacter kueseliae]|uniref:Uncharacterized protein n=1 Tax=Candidatus Sulfotelmatobacter kueseliae TaxID=2042962 RepID=A0A2U3LDI9_9BACT|nr:hypothetical protein SBA1_980006 [Candidatus Sulfotelmatobacter kueseliae]